MQHLEKEKGGKQLSREQTSSLELQLYLLVYYGQSASPSSP